MKDVLLNKPLEELYDHIIFLYTEYKKINPKSPILKEISIDSGKVRINQEFLPKYESKAAKTGITPLIAYDETLFLKLFNSKNKKNTFVKKFKEKFYSWD